MRAHLQALRTLLAPLGYPVHLFHAEGRSDVEVPPVPYLVLRGPSWADPDDEPVCGPGADLDARVMVTATASTVEGALVVLARVRNHLMPHAVLPVAGRHAALTRHRSEVEPQVDQDLRLPGSDRHPGFGVDSYRLHSVPKEGS